MVGGSIGITNTSVENIEYNSVSKSLSISPFFSYFPNDNLSIGMYFIFSSTENSRTNILNGSVSDSNKNTQQMVGLAPFIRYYMPMSPKFKFFGQLNVFNGFGTSKTDFSSSQQGVSGTIDIRQFGAAILPGFSFFANKNIGLECSFNAISYNKYKFNVGDMEIQNNDSFNFSLGDFNPNIGISYSF